MLANGEKSVLWVPKSAIFPGSWIETLLSVSVAGLLDWISALAAALQFLERGQLGTETLDVIFMLARDWHQKEPTSALKIIHLNIFPPFLGF